MGLEWKCGFNQGLSDFKDGVSHSFKIDHRESPVRGKGYLYSFLHPFTLYLLVVCHVELTSRRSVPRAAEIAVVISTLMEPMMHLHLATEKCGPWSSVPGCLLEIGSVRPHLRLPESACLCEAGLWAI